MKMSKEYTSRSRYRGLKISLSLFQLSREYVRIQRALRSKEKRYVVVFVIRLGRKYGNMKKRELYFSNGLYLKMYDGSKRNVPGWIFLLRRKKERYTENNSNERRP